MTLKVCTLPWGREEGGGEDQDCAADYVRGNGWNFLKINVLQFIRPSVVYGITHGTIVAVSQDTSRIFYPTDSLRYF